MHCGIFINMPYYDKRFGRVDIKLDRDNSMHYVMLTE